MPKLKVKLRDIDDASLFTHKTISLGSKSIETPAKAIPIGKTRRGKDTISAEARGFNEIYFQTDPKQLKKGRETFDNNLRKKLRNPLNKAMGDEFNVVFSTLETTRNLSRPNLEFLSDVIYSTSDFYTIPLMPDLMKAIKEDQQGTSSTFFERYLENVRNFVEISRQINGKPIMGTLPPLPWDFTNEIVNYYLDEGVRAFCFNFNGRTVTAENQLVNMVTPLMRRVATEDLEEDVLFYSINAHRGRSVKDGNYVPARDFLSFGFGFDVLGNKHIAATLPPQLYEKIANSDPTFRLFDREEYLYDSYEYDQELEDHIPVDTALDSERIINRPQDRYRLSALINSEQQAIESSAIRPAIDEHRILDHIEPKTGVGEDAISDMKQTRRSFDGRKAQTSLDDLDDLFD